MKVSVVNFVELDSDLLYDIMSLRQRIFVVEQNCAYLDADGIDKECLHVCLRKSKNQLLAYARIIPPGLMYPEACALGRVCVHEEYRQNGLGNQLMVAAIETCRSRWSTDIKISAQEYTLEFYKNLGFEVCGPAFLEDGIPHVPMLMSL